MFEERFGFYVVLRQIPLSLTFGWTFRHFRRTLGTNVSTCHSSCTIHGPAK